jgi:hypothetical protein
MYEDFDVNLTHTHIYILLMGRCSGMELILSLYQDVRPGGIVNLDVQSVPNY